MLRPSLPALLALSLTVLGPAAAQDATQAAAPAPAAAAKAEVPALPSKEVEDAYRNGELDSVVIYIKRGRQKPVFLDSRDSIVAFKYLGVIYSAEPQTREKGRYYFNQLLRKDPRATIADLGPGESARAAFKEVREEFFELNPGLRTQEPALAAAPAVTTAPAPPSASREPAPSSPPTAAAPEKKRSHAWLWVTGGVLVAGGAAAVALLDPPARTTRLHD